MNEGKKRFLTGVQSSGQPHLGNYIGAIKPAIELASAGQAEAYYFIADYHSLTTIRDPELRRANTMAVAATWLAFGEDVDGITLYRQSQIPEVTELSWLLSCFTSYGLLSRSTSFKDKSENLREVNAGLFTYPVLMAADILLFDADVVPVGKDQKQHLEITQMIAKAFNHHYGEVFKVPIPRIDAEGRMVPGVDGRKMSKSYGNAIFMMEAEAVIKKSVMSIVTDSRAVEDVKDPGTCNVFRLFELMAPADDVEAMRRAYLSGGMGYGDAKKKLLACLVETFAEERERYQELVSDEKKLEELLAAGEAKVRRQAREKIDEVREVTGFGKLLVP